MSDECIHGFEAGMCASCYPKPMPEAPVVAKTVTRSRPAAAGTSTARRSATATLSGPIDDVREQRIYHLTHIRNLPGILEHGGIRPDAVPEVELSPAGAREERREVSIGDDDATLAHYVPFFLSPNASLWQGIRAHAVHSRIARELRDVDAADFVLLVSTVRQLGTNEQPWAIAEGNAAGTTTRVSTTPEDADFALRRLRTDNGAEAILDAELLAFGEFPLESVSLIGVAHDKARSAVRQILADADFEVKVAVYPPWFANPND